MDTYVMIARHIGKVSGEKIYCCNKMEYMLSLGWRVLFLSCKREHPPFEGHPNYAHHVYPALAYTPECYSDREVKRTVDSIVRDVGSLGEGRCIVESDTVNNAVWGELIAARVGAKHLVFLLKEVHNYGDAVKAFLRFKYDRHELAGIAKDSIRLILDDDSVPLRDDTKISAFCNNSVRDCEDPVSGRLPDASVTFGSIGRLDKGCVPAILKAFRDYAEARPQERFNVVMIGGALGKNKLRQVSGEMKTCRNIHFLVTGYLYPIPESLIRRIDLFVSTAGSATVSYRFHRPTVKVHPVTGEPVGILGLDDTEGKSMYETLPDTTLGDCMERALSQADRIEYIYNGYEDYERLMHTEFARQLSIGDVTTEKAYYSEELLRKLRPTHIKGHKLHRAVGRLLGAGALNAFVNVYKALSN